MTTADSDKKQICEKLNQRRNMTAVSAPERGRGEWKSSLGQPKGVILDGDRHTNPQRLR